MIAMPGLRIAIVLLALSGLGVAPSIAEAQYCTNSSQCATGYACIGGQCRVGQRAQPPPNRGWMNAGDPSQGPTVVQPGGYGAPVVQQQQPVPQQPPQQQQVVYQGSRRFISVGIGAGAGLDLYQWFSQALITQMFMIRPFGEIAGLELGLLLGQAFDNNIFMFEALVHVGYVFEVFRSASFALQLVPSIGLGTAFFDALGLLAFFNIRAGLGVRALVLEDLLSIFLRVANVGVYVGEPVAGNVDVGVRYNLIAGAMFNF